MLRVSTLEWALVVGVVLLGCFLAVHFKKKYKIDMRDFLGSSFYVAALAAILIGLYEMLRGYAI
jgi:hypothetical protein